MFDYLRAKLLLGPARRRNPDPTPLPPGGGYVVRSDTHFLLWQDEIGETPGFGTPTIRPTIGWTDDMNLATIMPFQEAEFRLVAFPPGSCRIAKVTRIEVA